MDLLYFTSHLLLPAVSFTCWLSLIACCPNRSTSSCLLHRFLPSPLFEMFTGFCCLTSKPHAIDKLEQESFLESLPCSHRPCIFCDVSKENGFNVVWEVCCGCFPHVTDTDILQSDDFTVFTDINPSAQHHLQIVPKKHIGSLASSLIVYTMVDNPVVESVKSLDASDVQMGTTTSCTKVLSLNIIDSQGDA